MLSSKAFLSFLMRLPLFLVAHSVSVAFVHGFSWAAMFSIFIPFLLLSLMDEFVEKRRITIVVSIVVGAAVFAFGFIAAGILVVCMILFRWEMFDRPEIFSKSYFILGIAAHVVFAYFAPVGERHIIFISLFLTAVLLPICLQGSRLSGFLHSHHSRLASHKTATRIRAHGFRFHLILVAVVAFFSVVTIFFIPSQDVELLPPELEEEDFDTAEEPLYEQILEALVEVLDPLLPDGPMGPEEYYEGESLLENVLFNIISSIIVGGLILAVIAIAFWAVGKSSKKPKNEDFEEVFEAQAATPEQKAKKRRKRRVSSINQTVRKLFVRKVYDYRTHGLSPAKHDTPRHLSDIISESEDVSALDRLYHKARYSGNDVSGGELSAYYKERKGKG